MVVGEFLLVVLETGEVVASTTWFAGATVLCLGAVEAVFSAPLLDVSTVVVGVIDLVMDVRFGVDAVLATVIDVLKPCDVVALVPGETVLCWVVLDPADVFATIVVAVLFVSSDAVERCVDPNNKKICPQKVIEQIFFLPDFFSLNCFVCLFQHFFSILCVKSIHT